MIIEISKEEFDFEAKLFPDLTFYQSSNWAALKSYTGWKALYLKYLENNSVEGLGLFLLKKMPLLNAYLAYSPRGYLINYADIEQLKNFNNELLPFLKKKKVFQLIIDPYVLLHDRDINGDIREDSFDNTYIVETLKEIGYRHNGYNLYYENLQPRWLFRLNIKDKSFEELTKDFKKEAKRRASKKDLFAINVRELNKDEVPVFKNLMNMTSVRKGFIDRPLGYYQQMYDTLGNGILRYMVAEIDTDKCRENIETEIAKEEAKLAKLELHKERNEGKIKEELVTINSLKKIVDKVNECQKERGKIVPLSVVCLLTYGKEAIMLLAGNDEDYLQQFNTSNIIVSELIKLCKEEGYSYYNFYGITGNFDPKNEHYGLYTYKKQYGGEVVELIGQFEYTVNSFVKSLYDKMLKVYKLTKR
ncbi:MAG: peptidoglycan bridge formation glycyltransferase FemA/FemB family protein [Erysipelotrichaceae bacterium]|nr:peptidoglycan bridge formation glycyltransferase FemA/FemB family protein [Erysipelotrichaceae bacterium]